MERVRKEMEKTKTEYAKQIQEERQSSQKEMEKVRHQLEKTTRKAAKDKSVEKMSKSEAHEELLRVKEENMVKH